MELFGVFNEISLDIRSPFNFILCLDPFASWNMMRLRQSHKRSDALLDVAIYFEILDDSPTEEVKDLERILRHYYDADKFELRDIKKNLKNVNCSYFCQVFGLFQTGN